MVVYGSRGVDRLVLMPPIGASLAELEAFVRDHAPRRLAAASPQPLGLA